MDKETFIVTVVLLYLTFAHIFALIFLYLWSQNHGFLSTVFVGTFVSEIKGLLFPFFI